MGKPSKSDITTPKTGPNAQSKVRVRVPATSANLGPGFDTLGMALTFYNHFDALPADTLSVEVAEATCVDIRSMDLDPGRNLLAQAYCHFFEVLERPIIPAQLRIEAHIPLSRGLGSSSSAIVGGLFLANEMADRPCDEQALKQMAVALEGHPDNVVPALCGGVHCCITDDTSIRLTWPKDWGLVLLVPPYEVSTHQARGVMPGKYSTHEAVQGIRSMAAWMEGVRTTSPELMRYALATDPLHQPARRTLIPEFEQLSAFVLDPLYQQHALGVVISGSGSTCLMVTPTPVDAQVMKEALKVRFEACKVMVLPPDETGARRVEASSL